MRPARSPSSFQSCSLSSLPLGFKILKDKVDHVAQKNAAYCTIFRSSTANYETNYRTRKLNPEMIY